MRKLAFLATTCAMFVFMGAAYGQQVDVAVGLSSLSAPSGTTAASFPVVVSEGGGIYPAFSGDFLIRHNFGVEGEIAWRGSQGKYGGIVPFRPVFFDFNALYAPKLGRVTPELMAGIGVESLRFYSGTYTCSYFSGCTNYTSSNHFMGDVGGGLRFYVWHQVFFRPEARLYLVHNNSEFTSGRVVRYGASIGYTFGGFNP